MNLIEELKNYCDINNPVGALMLSGEWGCGKTYLIKTKFIPSVKDTYVFVCISLFGIDSLDKLRVASRAPHCPRSRGRLRHGLHFALPCLGAPRPRYLHCYRYRAARHRSGHQKP